MGYEFEPTLIDLGPQERNSAERVAKLIEDRTGIQARLFAGVPDQVTGLASQYITVDAPVPSIVPLVSRTAAVHVDQQVRGCTYRSASTIRADIAHSTHGATGKGIVWAVIDSGVDGSHPHFRRFHNLLLDPPLRHLNFVSGHETPETDYSDNSGHGTFMAGIIAGENQGVRVAEKSWNDDGSVNNVVLDVPFISGIAPECKILSLRVLDDEGKGRASTVIQAMAAIQNLNSEGKRVHGVNLGVYYEYDSNRFACGRSPICVEAERLVRSGVVVVAAAGNSGYGFQTLLMGVPKQQGLEASICDPGNAELVITVGSTDREMPQQYGISYFSSKGPTLDGRLKPDLVAPGERIVSCATGIRARELQEKHGMDASVIYCVDSGTSVAAAHVSGAAAALLSARPELVGQPNSLKEILMRSAIDLGRSPYYQGSGVIDVLQAIQYPIVRPLTTSEQLTITDASARRGFSEPQVDIPVMRPTYATPDATRALRVMYSYSHLDEPFKYELHAALASLRREGLIVVWQDRQILPGSEFDKDIALALQDSDIIILLVSKYFMDSDYCIMEMKLAIERYKVGTVIVVPVILKPVDWKESPFGKLTALPKDGKPITDWQTPDAAWADVAEGIRRLVIETRKR